MTHVNYNDGKWHGWNGGECPVHPLTRVDVCFKHDGVNENHNARFWAWSEGDIVAFRVIKEHREPREWWIYPDTGVVKETKPACPHAINVREVLE